MRGSYVRSSAAITLIWSMVSCTATTPEPEVAEVPVIALPSPRTTGGAGLDDVLASRRSIRDFSDRRLTSEEVSQLLWAAQGITAEWGGRTAPSAGALYPIEIYVATPDGLLHYLPEGHRVERLGDIDVRASLASSAGDQGALVDAPVVIVISSVIGRTEAKYGGRAERYVYLEAGHICQNILLEATALGLGAVPIGAFSDGEVRDVLGLPPDHTPVYLVPVGHPAQAS
jgi:SagB-type dehydrogenase domain